MQRWGASEAQLDSAFQRLTPKADYDAVWVENVSTVSAFLTICTQWRTALKPTEKGMRMLYIGFDYAAVRVGLEAMAIEITPRLWSGLLVMEQAARAALNGEVPA